MESLKKESGWRLLTTEIGTETTIETQKAVGIVTKAVMRKMTTSCCFPSLTLMPLVKALQISAAQT